MLTYSYSPKSELVSRQNTTLTHIAIVASPILSDFLAKPQFNSILNVLLLEYLFCTHFIHANRLSSFEKRKRRGAV